MVSPILITSLAVFASAAFANPILTSEITTTTPPPNAKVEDYIAPLRERKLNRRGELERRNPGGGWNGFVLDGLTSVHSLGATVTVPTPSVPTGGSSTTTFSSSAWVGIDGVNSPLWQVGFTFSIHGTKKTVTPWWEWAGGSCCGEVNFDDFKLEPGDVVYLSISGRSLNHTHSRGYATLENLHKRTKIYKHLDAKDDKPSEFDGMLPGKGGEWIVEDMANANGPVPFAAFDHVHFTGCNYADDNGTHGLARATMWNQVKQPDHRVVTDVKQTGAHSFLVTYNGTSY